MSEHDDARVEIGGVEARACRRLQIRCDLAVLAVAFTVRALYLFEMRRSTLFSVLFGDAERFDTWARRIAAGDWFGDQVFYFAPLYPYTMGGIYRLFGPHVEVVRWIQVLLGAFACVLVAATARRLLSYSAGALAGLLLALYPAAIFFDGLIQKACLGGFLTAAFLWFALHSRPSRRILLATGACLGLLALTRENALVLLPVVAIWVILREAPSAGVPPASGTTGAAAPQGASRAWRARLIAAGLLLLGAAAVLAPVGWRNQILGGSFLPTTAQLGPNFYIGNHSGSSGLYDPLPGGLGGIRHERRDAVALAEAASGRRLSAAEVSAWWLERSLADVQADPWEWVALLARKAMLLWQARELIDTEGIELYRDRSRVLRTLGTVHHFGVLLPLAAIGLWLTRCRWRRLWLLYAVILVLAVSVALFFVTARYRYSMVPPLAILAAGGLVELANLWRQRRLRQLAVALGVGAAGLLLAYWPFPLKEDPRAITLYNLGISLAAEDRLGEAETELDLALERKPGSPMVLAARGSVRSRQQRLGPSIEDFERALELDPDRAEAHAGLGRILVELGLPRLAASHFERLVEVSPQNSDALINLGNVRLLDGRLDEATELYREALRRKPESFEAAMSLGQALARRGETTAAMRLFKRARALRPGDPAPAVEIRGLEAVTDRGEPTRR